MHRTIFGGAFGVLIAASVAASAAYACHPKAAVVFSNYDNTITDPMPGQLIRVQGNGFDVGSTVKIWFGSTNASLLELGSTTASEVDRTGRLPQAELIVRIPEDAQWGHYLLGATQEEEEGKEARNPGLFVKKVYVGIEPSQPASSAPLPDPAPYDPPAPVSAPIVPGSVSVGSGAAQAPSAGVTPAPAVSPSTPAAVPGTANSAARPSADVAALPERLAKPGPAGPTPLPFELVGAPPAESLWTGLDAAQVPALLDAATPPPSRGGAAAGMVLLGFGAALLGGIALSVGRRRLALAARR